MTFCIAAEIASAHLEAGKFDTALKCVVSALSAKCTAADRSRADSTTASPRTTGATGGETSST